MEEIDFIYAAGKRVNSVLVYTTSDKYLFKRKRQKNGIAHYNCYTSNCIAKVQVQNGVCSRKTNSAPHSHSNHRELYDQFRSEFLMKTRTQSNPDLSIRNIVRNEIGNVAASPDSPYRRLRSSLYYDRQKNIPLNLRSLTATKVYVANNYVKELLSNMSRETTEIYHNISTDEETVYIVTAATDILKNLPDSRQAVITSSSRVAPSTSFFKLLLTISIIKMKEVSRGFQALFMIHFEIIYGIFFCIFRHSHAYLS